jgi:hypothetical protein
VAWLLLAAKAPVADHDLKISRSWDIQLAERRSRF